MPNKSNLLSIDIDAQLAADYRIAYEKAFGPAKNPRKSLTDFIAGFVEDRLAEELEFVQNEMRSGRD